MGEKRSGLVLSLVSLLVLVCAASETRADTLVVTNGSINLVSPTRTDPHFRALHFHFGTGGFDAEGHENNGPEATVTHDCGGGPCLAGSSMIISSSTALFTSAPAAVHIAGQRYDGSFAGSLVSFTTDAFVLPSSAQTVVVLRVPFTMTGVVTVSALDPATNVFGQVFSSPVAGSGSAEIFLTLQPNGGGYAPHGVSYTFGRPLPEPATLLLLGTGLAGALLRGRRRRRT